MSVEMYLFIPKAGMALTSLKNHWHRHYVHNKRYVKIVGVRLDLFLEYGKIIFLATLTSEVLDHRGQ